MKIYEKKNKLWYFDPPYHPWCLHAGKDAPYADTFDLEHANEMIDILHGDMEDVYGKLEFFIKSDYDPKEACRIAEVEKDNKAHGSQQLKWYKKLLAMEEGNIEVQKEFESTEKVKNTPWSKGMVSGLFDKLEKYPFCKVCVGGFDKGRFWVRTMKKRKV